MISGKINCKDGGRSSYTVEAIRVKTRRQAKNNRNEKKDFAYFIYLIKKTYYGMTEIGIRKWKLRKKVSIIINFRKTSSEIL
jgi:hypothetical protein